MDIAPPPADNPATRWDTNLKRIVLIGVVIGAIALLYISRSVVPNLVMAAILAYLIHPLVNRLARRLPRGLATILVYLAVIIVLVMTPIIMIPVIVQQIGTIDIRWNDIFVNLTQWVASFPQRYPAMSLFGLQIELQPWYDYVTSSVAQLQATQAPSASALVNTITSALGSATTVLGIAGGVASGIFTGLFALLLTLVYSFYMVKDAPGIRQWFDEKIPTHYQPEYQELATRVSLIWQSFFRGQLILSIVIGFTITALMTLVGMPGAFLLGLLAGVLEIVPNVGPILAMIPALLVAIFQGSSVLPVSNFTFMLITLAIYFIVQQVENNYFVPRIIGQSVNLHPLVILAGVIVGATQAGILGAFLAAPVLASVRVIGSYAHAKILDREPFPAPPPVSPRPPSRWQQMIQRRPKQDQTAPPPAQANSPTPASPSVAERTPTSPASPPSHTES